MSSALAWLAPGRALRRHAEGARPLDDALVGRLGELLVARRLDRARVRVVARRLATRWGELDLVARAGHVLVVLEVKTGFAGRRHRPGDRLAPERVPKLADAARALARRVGAAAWRVELAEVLLDRGGGLEVRRATLEAGAAPHPEALGPAPGSSRPRAAARERG